MGLRSPYPAPFRAARTLSLCMEAARAPYDYHLEAAEAARHSTEIARFSVLSLRSLCTDLPWLAPEGPYKKSHDARSQWEHIHYTVATYNTKKNAQKFVDKFNTRRPGQMWTNH